MSEFDKTIYKISTTPVPKPRMTQRDRWQKRPCVQRYYAYKDELRSVVSYFKTEGAVSIRFGMPMPKSWSAKKKTEMAGKPHKQKPDVDNLIKATLDALLDEDSHVYAVSATKFWSEQPFVVIETDYVTIEAD